MNAPGDDHHLLEEIRGIAALHLDLRLPPGTTIERGSRLREDLGLDSLQAMTLAVEVENRFRLRIPPEIEAELRTVDDLLRAIRRLLETGPAEPSDADVARGRSGGDDGDGGGGR